MEISCNKKNRNLIVKLNGEVDHHTSEEIRETVDKEFDLSGIKNIVFDFSQVGFMDSSGIGMVIGRYKNCQQAGGKVLVAGVTEPVDKIFRISGLYKIIPGYQSVKDALNSLS